MCQGIADLRPPEGFRTATDGWTLNGMFERFTAESRGVVVRAKELAHIAGRSEVGSVDLLLALTEERESVVSALLTGIGVDVESLRRDVDPGPSSGAPPPWQLPFGSDAKRALEGSLREALQLGHNYIGPEHVLLGVSRGRSAASIALTAAGGDPRVLRERVRETAAASETTTPYAIAADALADSAAALLAERDAPSDDRVLDLEQALHAFRALQPTAPRTAANG